MYQTWKSALKIEVKGLDVSMTEWLSILELRTTDIALEIVMRAKRMGVAELSWISPFTYAISKRPG